MKYKEMKQKDIRILKEKIWLANDKKCPILDVEIPLDKMALDHAHKKKDEAYAPDKGVIRTALEFRTNAFFGKMENAFKRYGLNKEHNLSDMLRNAADYFDEGAYVDEEGFMYIHPLEVPAVPKLKKQCYNKLLKVYDGKAKFPEYPKSKKLTKKLEELFNTYSIEIEYYK